MAILEVKHVSKHFGGLVAVNNLDLAINESEILGIIGPNGAGKTTLFNIIIGILPPTKGEVIFKGSEITRLPVHDRVKRGIAITSQLTNLFMDLSVYRNVYIGYHCNYKSGPIRQFLHTSRARNEQRLCNKKTLDILEFMGLSSMKHERAKNLPYGHQRILGICIALATRPTILLLDEPVTGMNPEETMSAVKLIKKIRNTGVTILIIEHDMAAIMNLCDRISVMDYGVKIADGLPEDIRANESVIEAYLGRGEDFGNDVRD